MSITFNDVQPFDSGPCLAVIQPMGTLLQALMNQGQNVSGFSAVGPLAFSIEVRGRLLSSEMSLLMDQLMAIEALLTDPPISATLIVHDGREFADMSLIRFERTGPVDVGRVESQGYVAVFMRLPR